MAPCDAIYITNGYAMQHDRWNRVGIDVHAWLRCNSVAHEAKLTVCHLHSAFAFCKHATWPKRLQTLLTWEARLSERRDEPNLRQSSQGLFVNNTRPVLHVLVTSQQVAIAIRGQYRLHQEVVIKHPQYIAIEVNKHSRARSPNRVALNHTALVFCASDDRTGGNCIWFSDVVPHALERCDTVP